MRENDSLEEIFDRYVGLELLNRDWTHAPEAAWLPGPGTGRDRAAAGEFWPDFWGEPLLQGVAGST
jgi:hypothetical protein